VKGKLVSKKPFIQLFKTPNSSYILDVNKNELIPICEESFVFLSKVLNGGEDGLSPTEEILALQGKGYLSTESNVHQIKHVYTEFLPYFLDRKMGKITLQVTQNCNFRCKYCVYTPKENMKQRTHSQKSMSWRTAKAAVDFLWNHSVDSKKVNIGFYGGEPLIEFPLIRRVVKYSQKLFEGKDLSFSVTCNGSLLNREIIRYFSENSVDLMISLDGPKEINDLNRVFANGKGTFDTVINALSLVREVDPDYAERIQISMVMDPKNDFDCINQIFLVESEVNNLAFQPSLVDHELDGEELLFSEEYSWKYTYQQFLAVMMYFGRFDKTKVSPIALRGLDPFSRDDEVIGQGMDLMDTDAPAGPCIPGQLRAFVDVDGTLFPCERVSEISSAMQIGDIFDGFKVHKASDILNVGQLTSEACRNCWCFRYCNQCAKRALGLDGLLSAEARLNHCADTRNQAYHKIALYLLMKETPIFYKNQIGTELR
jgi:uncharacterized protein